MLKNGFVKILMASPNITIGNPLYNVEPILNILDETDAEISLFPELCITGYSAGDLFFQSTFIENAKAALKQIITKTKNERTFILGLPILIDDSLYNVAVVVNRKQVIGVIPKYHLPNYKEFNEKRWFNSGALITLNKVKLFDQKVPFGKLVFKSNEFNFGVEICQDMWMLEAPSDILIKNGAHMILNLSASSEFLGKSEARKIAVIDSSRRQKSAYIYSSSGPSESVVDIVYSPHKIAASLGELLVESTIVDFQVTLPVDINIEAVKYARRIDSNWKDLNHFDAQDEVDLIPFEITESASFAFAKPLDQTPFIPKSDDLQQLSLATAIQVQAIISKLSHFKQKSLIIGVSGGLDSSLALLVAHRAFTKMQEPLKNIIAVSMPSKNSSTRSTQDASNLIDALGVTKMVIPIDDMLKQHLDDIKHQKLDVTYENAQARIRTLTLMDLANQKGALVLGTGDLSEIALGWMTYNGDHMSNYSINAGIPKTLVRELVRSYANTDNELLKKTLLSIVGAPISPELLTNQTTESIVGLYEHNDFLLYHHLGNGASEERCRWLLASAFNLSAEQANSITKNFFDRFYSQQFKRQVMPEGPKVINISLSPRGDTRLPSEMKR